MAILPPIVGNFLKLGFFWGKMPKLGRGSCRTGCAQTHDIRMKKMDMPQVHEKIKTNFPWRSAIGDFGPKLPKMA